jgi:hypothetical protein
MKVTHAATDDGGVFVKVCNRYRKVWRPLMKRAKTYPYVINVACPGKGCPVTADARGRSRAHAIRRLRKALQNAHRQLAAVSDDNGRL